MRRNWQKSSYKNQPKIADEASEVFFKKILYQDRIH